MRSGVPLWNALLVLGKGNGHLCPQPGGTTGDQYASASQLASINRLVEVNNLAAGVLANHIVVSRS